MTVTWEALGGALAAVIVATGTALAGIYKAQERRDPSERLARIEGELVGLRRQFDGLENRLRDLDQIIVNFLRTFA